MVGAIRIGRYLVQHALAAFEEMGVDPATEDARVVLAWLVRTNCESFTVRDAHVALRGRFHRAADLALLLEVLAEHDYIRAKRASEREGPGRRPSPRYRVNPFATQYTQSTQLGVRLNSVDCVDSVQGVAT